jgi:hypothetical protein
MTEVVLNATEPRPAGRAAGNIALHATLAALMYHTAMSLFIPAAFIHSALRNGRRGLWAAVAGASLLLALIAPLLASSASTQAALSSLARFILEIGLPSAAAAALVLRAVPFGSVLVTAVGASLGGFMATELAMRQLMNFSPYGMIVGNFKAMAQAAVDFYRTQGMPAETLRGMERISDAVVSGFMPALLLCVTALMFALSLAIIPRLPAGRATGTTYLFRNLSLPDSLLFAFVAGGLSPLASGALRSAGLNLLIAVAFLYMLQGLAIIRSMILKMGFGPLGTMIAWLVVALLVVYGAAPLALAILGLFDSFFDFRKLHRKESSDESNTD